MPPLSQHQSKTSTKLLVLGDSGTGKTGALASLVKAGYKLRILDFDNGLDILRTIVQKECPDKANNVEFRTLRDKMKASDIGPVLDGLPTAFTAATKMLDNWVYEEDGVKTDLGKPSTWGEDTILVLDSLTFFADAAYNWADVLRVPGVKDKRQTYGEAQKGVETTISYITAKSFKPSVIVLAHIRYSTTEGEAITKGFPNTIGSALGPVIPAYFNSIALATKTVSGTDVKRVIRTTPTAMIDLKNPAPFTMAPQYPLDIGLAEFFKNVRA